MIKPIGQSASVKASPTPTRTSPQASRARPLLGGGAAGIGGNETAGAGAPDDPATGGVTPSSSIRSTSRCRMYRQSSTKPRRSPKGIVQMKKARSVSLVAASMVQISGIMSAGVRSALGGTRDFGHREQARRDLLPGQRDRSGVRPHEEARVGAADHPAQAGEPSLAARLFGVLDRQIDAHAAEAGRQVHA